jgi:hypothetical protein
MIMKKITLILTFFILTLSLFGQTERNRVTLRSWFETGDKPTQSQFEDLIESMYNFQDDGALTTILKTSDTTSIVVTITQLNDSLANYMDSTETIDSIRAITSDSISGSSSNIRDTVNQVFIDSLYVNQQRKFDSLSLGQLKLDSLVWQNNYQDNWNYGKMQVGEDSVFIEFRNKFPDFIHQLGGELVFHVINKSGAQIDNGTPVRIDGATGDKPNIVKSSNSTKDSSCVLGVTTFDIANNAEGLVTRYGQYTFNTSGYSLGDTLYLSTNGDVIDTMVNLPSELVRIGTVSKVGTSGRVLLDILKLYDNLQDNGVVFKSSNNGFLTDANNFNYTDARDSLYVKRTESEITYTDTVNANDDLMIYLNNLPRWVFDFGSSFFGGSAASHPAILREISSMTNPVLSISRTYKDADGIGGDIANDTIAMILDNVSRLSITPNKTIVFDTLQIGASSLKLHVNLDTSYFETDHTHIFNINGTERMRLNATELKIFGDVNLTTGNDYKINDASILNATTLGTTVINSNLTSVGTLNQNLAVTGDISAGDDLIATNDVVAGDNFVTNDTLFITTDTLYDDGGDLIVRTDTLEVSGFVKSNGNLINVISLGSNNEIPFMNSGGTDVEYDSDFTWTGTELGINGNTFRLGPNGTIKYTDAKYMDYFQARNDPSDSYGHRFYDEGSLVAHLKLKEIDLNKNVNINDTLLVDPDNTGDIEFEVRADTSYIRNNAIIGNNYFKFFNKRLIINGTGTNPDSILKSLNDSTHSGIYFTSRDLGGGNEYNLVNLASKNPIDSENGSLSIGGLNEVEFNTNINDGTDYSQIEQKANLLNYYINNVLKLEVQEDTTFINTNVKTDSILWADNKVYMPNITTDTSNYDIRINPSTGEIIKSMTVNAGMYLDSNANSTTISVTGAWVKIGNMTQSTIFDGATYTTDTIHITVTGTYTIIASGLSAQSSVAGSDYEIGVSINGNIPGNDSRALRNVGATTWGDFHGISFHKRLTAGDYIIMKVRDLSSTRNITFKYGSIIIDKIN